LQFEHCTVITMYRSLGIAGVTGVHFTMQGQFCP
jgi:hypothetical protein